MIVGDLAHLYYVYVNLGWELLLDYENWNDMTFGNIVITTGLFVSRLAWFIFVGLRRSNKKHE
jgi:hypothetical protein